MDEKIWKLVEQVFAGGSTGVIALLILVILGLLWDRKNLMSTLEKRDSRIESILELYHKGQLTVTEALNNITVVLAEIKGRL